MNRLCITLIALAAALAVAGCATTTKSGTVGVERSQLMLVSSEQVDQAASKQYLQLTQKAAQQGTLNQDPAQTQRVRDIAAKLIPQTAVFRPEAPGWKWQVNVLTSKDVNAWCMPGGKMAVYTGLIEKVRPTDDELAAVMGHEIAHALREHGRERVSQQIATQTVVGLGAILLGVGQTGADLGGMVAQVTVGLPHSRGQEQEADRIGVELAARAGYDPRAAITLWEKMAKAGGGAPPEILSTHPAPATRIEDLKVYSAKVLPLYEAAKR
jgi:predicted Zn-dependent protease